MSDRKRVIALALCSVFNHFLSCIHYLKKDYKTEKNKEDIFTTLPALSISSIFRLIHFFYEHQKICRSVEFFKKVLKRLFFRTAALALRKWNRKLYSWKHVHRRGLSQHLPYSRSRSAETEQKFWRIFKAYHNLRYNNLSEFSKVLWQPSLGTHQHSTPNCTATPFHYSLDIPLSTSAVSRSLVPCDQKVTLCFTHIFLSKSSTILTF